MMPTTPGLAGINGIIEPDSSPAAHSGLWWGLSGLWKGLSGFCLQTVQTVLDSWDSWAKWLPTATLTVSDYCDRFVTKFSDERARLPVLELRGYGTLVTPLPSI